MTLVTMPRNLCLLTDLRVFKRNMLGGCFGDGPGRLDLGEGTQGKFFFDARLMQPNTKYVMTVIVKKDVRTSTASQILEVVTGDPSMLLIEYVH